MQSSVNKLSPVPPFSMLQGNCTLTLSRIMSLFRKEESSGKGFLILMFSNVCRQEISPADFPSHLTSRTRPYAYLWPMNDQWNEVIREDLDQSQFSLWDWDRGLACQRSIKSAFHPNCALIIIRGKGDHRIVNGQYVLH